MEDIFCESIPKFYNWKIYDIGWKNSEVYWFPTITVFWCKRRKKKTKLKLPSLWLFPTQRIERISELLYGREEEGGTWDEVN